MTTDSKVQVHNPAWLAAEVAPELIGRDQELVEVVAALRLHPLMTLVGPGGIGKTSLAMAAAYAVADQFADGVYVVPLAEVTTHELLVLVTIQ
jgi:predicted ATPase